VYAVVAADMLDKATELRLSAAEVRGLSVTGVLTLNRFDLTAGELG